jgi:thiol:disulfide interchange protein DsbC
LLSSETADNLTIPHQLAFNAKLFQSLPRENAIKTVYGKGERTMITIEDPDCPGCREFTRLLHAYPDPDKLNLTVYTFPFPLENIHPDARTKAVTIWCSSNTPEGRSSAWKKWMLNSELPKVQNCQNPVRDNLIRFQSIGVGATPTLFLPDGSAVMGGVEPDKLIKALDVMYPTKK